MHKKNIMKKIIIIFLGVFCSIITKAQDIVSKYTLSQLVGTVWVDNTDEEEVSTLTFFQTYYTVSVNFKTINKTVENKYEYYLSDTPLQQSYDISIFDSLKVGNSEKGTYIIYKYESPKIKKIKGVDCYKIESLDNKELLLFHKLTVKSVGGRDVYIRYKRVK